MRVQKLGTISHIQPHSTTHESTSDLRMEINKLSGDLLRINLPGSMNSVCDVSVESSDDQLMVTSTSVLST